MLSHAMKEKLVSILHDDLGRGDLTSHLLKPKRCRANIIAKESCIVAGLEEAHFLFHYRKVKAIAKAGEGSHVRKGTTVMVLKGSNRSILEVERTALNIISRMSAVVSACKEAQKIAGRKITIALTRKTMPGFNLFDNRAAEIAGIWTHRINLNSFVLLKNNHLCFFSKPSEAVLAARQVYGNSMPVEIEVDSLKQALDAITAKPDILMLDNFSPKEARKAAKAVRRKGFQGKIELSGGIDLNNLKKYKAVGADIISMGSLTHSVLGKNFSLEIVK